MPTSASTTNANWALLFLCWLIAATATTGSLFFSNVMDFAPCILCWYQRISLFPLVIILATGLFPLDPKVIKYALPLTIIGWLIALYHTLLYAGIIPEDIQPCSQGVSCTEDYIDIFGFISIPMLSLFAFSTIIVLLLILKRRMPK